MRIGVLTGGGDVPGLNSALKSLTLNAAAQGYEVLGFRRGWHGVMAVDPQDAASVSAHTMPLTPAVVRTIDRTGGTVLHTSRTHPGRMRHGDIPDHLRGLWPSTATHPSDDAAMRLTVDLTPAVLRSLEALHIDVLVAIGGDDTLSYAAHLYRLGMPVIGIPKTMDNDVRGTDYCLGFATCVSRTVTYLQQLRTCAGSHERIAVVEVMGRHAGATALIPGYLAQVDRVLIAEVPVDTAHLASLVQHDCAHNPSGYALVVVSEGARLVRGSGSEAFERGEADAYGHRKLGGIGEQVGTALKAHTGLGIINQSLGYLVRAGPPDPLDLMASFNFAHLAIELIAQHTFGRLVHLKAGRYGHGPLQDAGEGPRALDVAHLYDAATYTPRITSVLGLPMYL